MEGKVDLHTQADRKELIATEHIVHILLPLSTISTWLRDIPTIATNRE